RGGGRPPARSARARAPRLPPRNGAVSPRAPRVPRRDEPERRRAKVPAPPRASPHPPLRRDEDRSRVLLPLAPRRAPRGGRGGARARPRRRARAGGAPDVLALPPADRGARDGAVRVPGRLLPGGDSARRSPAGPGTLARLRGDPGGRPLAEAGTRPRRRAPPPPDHGVPERARAPPRDRRAPEDSPGR